MRKRYEVPTKRALTPLGVALGVALGLVGCGGTQVPSFKKVISAMRAQPRMIVTLTGGSIRRAVIDTAAQYLAVYSLRNLLLLDRDRVEYRPANGCFDVSTGGQLRSDSLWAGALDDVASTTYTTRVSGANVTYTSPRGQVTVDARTDLVRSARTAGVAASGVPATTATFSYPRSVRQLPAPTRLCH